MNSIRYKIYPKQFRTEKIPIEKGRCFFIMPFAEEFDLVYGAIKKSFHNHEYICSRVDEISGSTPIMNKILCEILRAQFIIVDVSGSNANVFYELGIAHTFKDAENIFLIKEKGDDARFDITHLKYIEYERDNLPYMVSLLRESLDKNKHISDFYEALNVLNIINYNYDNQDEFVDILKGMIGGNLPQYTDILTHQDMPTAEDSLHLLTAYAIELRKKLNGLKFDTVAQLFSFYSELLLACGDYSFVEQLGSDVLNGFFADSELSETEVTTLKTSFVLKFARAHTRLGLVMPWIIAYFEKSKFASIDLNRYSLETFLLSTEFEDINAIIGNALRNKDCHIREHMSDIIGEKGLLTAEDNLIQALKVEENYYSAGSIIGALGKIRSAKSAKPILKWLKANENEILGTKSYFVLKRAKIALSQIDKEAAKQFEQKYGERLLSFYM